MPKLILISILLFCLSACQTIDRGNFGQFKKSLNNRDYGYSVIEDPTKKAPSKLIERFEVRNGDCHFNKSWSDCKTDRERSELSQRTNLPVTGESWYGWHIFVPKDFKNIFPTKTALGQFHQRNSHPLWMFQNTFGGYWLDKQVIGATEKYFELIPKDEFRGKWHQIEMHVKWAPDETGFMKIWVNGKKKFDFKGQTGKSNPIYFKYGIYRSFLSRYKEAYGKDEIPTQIVYYANVKRATSREGLQAP